MLYIIWTS